MVSLCSRAAVFSNVPARTPIVVTRWVRVCSADEWRERWRQDNIKASWRERRPWQHGHEVIQWLRLTRYYCNTPVGLRQSDGLLFFSPDAALCFITKIVVVWQVDRQIACTARIRAAQSEFALVFTHKLWQLPEILSFRKDLSDPFRSLRLAAKHCLRVFPRCTSITGKLNTSLQLTRILVVEFKRFFRLC